MTYGGELSLRWKPASRWRISPRLPYLHATIRQDLSSKGPSEFTRYRISAEHVRDPLVAESAKRTEFDQWRSTADYAGGTIPVARFDFRLARHFGERAEISPVGKNSLRLVDLSEFGDANSIAGTQAVRRVYKADHVEILIASPQNANSS